MASSVAFALFSVIVVVAAWRVVSSHDIVRSALALVVVLGGLAPLFILLAAEFVAVIQVLVYVGAVIILFLFGIMLTRSPATREKDHNRPRRWLAAVTGAGLFGVLWYSITQAFGDAELEPASVGRTAEVGNVLLREYVVAFEAVSVLLLAALIGAIVLARRD